ncbi:MAG: hypothetical protein ABJM26_01500 [Anderseniella sp.]
MNIHTSGLSPKSRIPVERILEARASFPHGALSFEIEFEGEGLTALSDLVLLFTRAGLTCDCLRYRRNGTILALLCDNEYSNFRLMDAALTQSVSLTMVRWTIVLSKPLD